MEAILQSVITLSVLLAVAVWCSYMDKKHGKKPEVKGEE
jgi:hypothetical protein